MQIRAISGYSFEREVREGENFERYIRAPRIKWSGVGRNNVERLVSLNKDPELFKPIIKESKFVKADAKDVNSILYEIKKYYKHELNKFRLYSEPIIKVSPSRSKWGKGNPYYDNFKDCNEYNDFINKITKTKWWKKYKKTILENIYKSNSGLFTRDGFIPYSELEFKWVINKGEYAPIFENYHRLTIVFRLKQKLTIINKILKFVYNTLDNFNIASKFNKNDR
jgi:hypothetical protein